jgi:hypothetical protein
VGKNRGMVMARHWYSSAPFVDGLPWVGEPEFWTAYLADLSDGFSPEDFGADAADAGANREHELHEQTGHLRSRIEELTARLGELDAEKQNLRITRKTLLAIPAPAPAEETPRPDVPDHPAYQQILTALIDASRPMRARDLCEALYLPILPKNTEGIRCKLKRLVTRGILTEPEPGLFVQPST